MSDTSRRRVLVAVVVVLVAFGGCLTTDPSITANTGDSAVFESLSINEPWVGQQFLASATLVSGSNAGNVTQLTVVNAKGGSVSTTTVDPGQTSVSVTVPANANVTIVASDSVNGTTIEKLNATTGGDKLI